MSKVELKDYEAFVQSTISQPSTVFGILESRLSELDGNKLDILVPELLTASLGLTAESGEFAEVVKKIVFQGKPLDEDNILTVFGKSAYKVEIKYNNIFRYDEIKPTEKLRVLDSIKAENILTTDIETINKINTGEDFITEFYTMINNKISELIAVSHLTQEQLKQESYSEVYARLKATEVLKEHGVVGRYEPLSNGSGRTHKIKTSILKREILLDTKEVEDKILMERKETKDNNLKKITQMLGNPYAA